MRSVKTCLRKTLGKGVFTLELFSTVLCELEEVVDSRSLRYIYEEHEDRGVIAPSHFFSGKKSDCTVCIWKPSANEHSYESAYIFETSTASVEPLLVKVATRMTPPLSQRSLQDGSARE